MPKNVNNPAANIPCILFIMSLHAKNIFKNGANKLANLCITFNPNMPILVLIEDNAPRKLFNASAVAVNAALKVFNKYTCGFVSSDVILVTLR